MGPVNAHRIPGIYSNTFIYIHEYSSMARAELLSGVSDQVEHKPGCITQTRPCNIQQYFTAVEITIFSLFFSTIYLFLLKTYIVGTR